MWFDDVGAPARGLSDHVEIWRREYNHERPKRVLGGLTPVEYARRLTEKVGDRGVLLSFKRKDAAVAAVSDPDSGTAFHPPSGRRPSIQLRRPAPLGSAVRYV